MPGARCFISVRNGGIRRHMQNLELDSCQLAQSGEESHPDGDCYRHEGILLSKFATLRREGEQGRLPGRQAGSASPTPR